jgi:hypothetical protein
MKAKAKNRYFVNDLTPYVGRIITFKVNVAHSGHKEDTQTPLFLLREVKETASGHLLLVGVNLKRVEDIHTLDRNTVPFRSFRVDRVQFGSLKVIV